MTAFYLILVLCMFTAHHSSAAIAVSRVNVRVPKENDIGLIFDLNVVNNLIQRKEMLEFLVRPDHGCTLNLTGGEIMSSAGRVVGGNFGSIEAGASKTVSLIWPTVSLYNRVGSCSIIITSTNAKGEEVHLKHLLSFDTTFTTLDPDSRTLRKHKDFKDCNNWDLNYFANCTPIDCEQRYFGRRSFYNCSTKRCEKTEICTQPNQLYDIFANECITLHNFVTEDDLQNIKRGKFENNFLNFKCEPPMLTERMQPQPGAPRIVVNELKSDSKQNQGPPLRTRDNGKALHVRETDALDYRNPRDSAPMLPYWLKGLLDGLFIVFATIVIYGLICFIIFLVVSWISRRNFKRGRAVCDSSPSQRDMKVVQTNTTLQITNSSLILVP